MRFFPFLCFVVALYLGSHARETEGKIITTLSLRLTGKTSDRQTYSQFIVALLRRALPVESQKVYNLPVLSGTTQGVDFLYLRLTDYDRNEVTLAMDATSLYILGSTVSGKTEKISYFFADVPKETQDKLFDGTTRKTLSYKGNYDSLGDRKKVDLGIPALSTAIKNLYFSTGEPDRSIYIVMIQMVSEACRFKYIERQISNKPGTVPTNFKPNPKFLSLEKKWSKLSKQIQLAVKNKGVFPTPVQLRDENDDIFYVENVSSTVVTEDIAILLNSRAPDEDNGDSNLVTVTPSEVMVETGEGSGADHDEPATHYLRSVTAAT